MFNSVTTASKKGGNPRKKIQQPVYMDYDKTYLLTLGDRTQIVTILSIQQIFQPLRSNGFSSQK